MITLPSAKEALKTNNIFRRNGGGCYKGGIILIYKLPVRLEPDVLPFIQGLGRPAFDFKKMQLLKIETPNYIITGVTNLKEIRFTYKDDSAALTLDRFENSIIEYVKVKEKR
jgi:hypothetical protein